MTNSCCTKSNNNKAETKTLTSEKHWDNAYINADITKLGWYEKQSLPSLQLIEKTGISKNAIILNVGAGATTLVDDLLEKGFKNQIVNDISNTALNNIKNRITNKENNIQFITDDIINSKYITKIQKVDLWNDRAVLHFFTKEKDQDKYFNLLKEKVKSGAYAILSEFNLQGAKKCSGLDVKRYNADMLQKKLGKDFVLLEKFDYDYLMPKGEIRKYIYTLFKRK